jgi:hypothetical protein
MGGAALFGVGVALTAYGEYKGLKAQQQSAKFQAQIARINTKIIDERIKDIRGLGARAALQLEQEGVEIVAGQVTAYAGRNIDISSAVVTQKIEDTSRIVASDVIDLQHNIENEIWGLKTEKVSQSAIELFNKARARSAGRLAPIVAGATLLTGFSQFLPAKKVQLPAKQPSPLARLPLRTLSPIPPANPFARLPRGAFAPLPPKLPF